MFLANGVTTILFSNKLKNIGVIIATSLTIFISNVSLTAVSLALFSIATSFGSSIAVTQWVMSSYIIAAGMFMILGGRLADVFGQKKIFILSLSVWLVSSILAGGAQSTSFLIVARILQGFAFAFSLPICMVIITKVFSKEQLGLAVSINIAVTGFSQAIGPTFGAYLLEYFNWRWIFFINVPFVILALISASLSIKKDIISPKKTIIDYSGAILLAASLFGLMFYLNLIQQHIFSVPILVFIFIPMLFIFYVFYFVERKIKNPIIDFSLLFERSFLVINILRMLFQFVYFALLFILPYYFLTILKMTPIQTGKLLLFMTVTFACLTPIIGKISDRIGERLLIIVGFPISIVSFYSFATFGSIVTYSEIIFPLILMGIATAIIFNCSTSWMLSLVPLESKGLASGIFFTNTLIGGAIGITISSIMLQLMARFYRVNFNGNFSYLTQEEIHEGLIHAFSGIMWMCFGILMIGFLLALFQGKSKKRIQYNF